MPELGALSLFDELSGGLVPVFRRLSPAGPRRFAHLFHSCRVLPGFFGLFQWVNFLLHAYSLRLLDLVSPALPES